MYLNKKDKEYIQHLVFKDYCLTCNTRQKAECEGDFNKANDLLYHELYLKELLINKFGMSEERLYNLQRKMYIHDTY